ncbi:MAG: tryptophan 7-halogenase [Gammaproteobacteria bacterium]|nr:tryptophan 7-halogenase [Gammaproteobacteria bacterium]
MAKWLENPDILIVGAGPSGAIAGALLARKGYSVMTLEKQTFPRFSIGESLLPQCMEFIEEAGMLEAVNNAGLQYKNGAAFRRGDTYTDFDFSEKFTPGWGNTFQVQRAGFDKLLADESAKSGNNIFYEQEIIAVTPDAQQPSAVSRAIDGSEKTVRAKFILDASGFGRVLPRLLNLNKPSEFPVRQAYFTHVMDNIEPSEFDRHKILVSVHPEFKDVWFWLIPFAGGRCSLGVVASQAFLDRYPEDPEIKLRQLVKETPALQHLLRNAEYAMPVRSIVGYAADVTSLYGQGYALLGNAGEFLDPVFSSGVTIAMKSASMAANLLDRQLQGGSVDWQTEYAKPLQAGVNAFRMFVEAWYDGRFQDIIFYQGQSPEIRGMICSILAGYAWDQKNPYVSEPRRLNTLAEICRSN